MIGAHVRRCCPGCCRTPGDPSSDRDTRPTVARHVVIAIVGGIATCRCSCGIDRMLTADEVYSEAVPQLDDMITAMGAAS